MKARKFHRFMTVAGGFALASTLNTTTGAALLDLTDTPTGSYSSLTVGSYNLFSVESSFSITEVAGVRMLTFTGSGLPGAYAVNQGLGIERLDGRAFDFKSWQAEGLQDSGSGWTPAQTQAGWDAWTLQGERPGDARDNNMNGRIDEPDFSVMYQTDASAGFQEIGPYSPIPGLNLKQHFLTVGGNSGAYAMQIQALDMAVKPDTYLDFEWATPGNYTTLSIGAYKLDAMNAGRPFSIVDLGDNRVLQISGQGYPGTGNLNEALRITRTDGQAFDLLALQGEGLRVVNGGNLTPEAVRASKDAYTLLKDLPADLIDNNLNGIVDESDHAVQLQTDDQAGFQNFTTSGWLNQDSYREHYLTVGWDYTSSDTYALQIDNLTFSNPVPEPETWAMLMVGMGLIGLRLEQRRSVSFRLFQDRDARVTSD
jgi:hypothetical protein